MIAKRLQDEVGEESKIHPLQQLYLDMIHINMTIHKKILPRVHLWRNKIR